MHDFLINEVPKDESSCRSFEQVTKSPRKGPIDGLKIHVNQPGYTGTIYKKHDINLHFHPFSTYHFGPKTHIHTYPQIPNLRFAGPNSLGRPTWMAMWPRWPLCEFSEWKWIYPKWATTKGPWWFAVFIESYPFKLGIVISRKVISQKGFERCSSGDIIEMDPAFSSQMPNFLIKHTHTETTHFPPLRFLGMDFKLGMTSAWSWIQHKKSLDIPGSFQDMITMISGMV